MAPWTQNREEVEGWYGRYGAALLLFGTALTGDRGRAQDALHQVFLSLLKNRELDRISDIRTYLFAAVRNSIVTDAKRGRRDVPLEPSDESWFESPNDYLDEISIRRALTGLPSDQREIVVLHIWAGLTFSQAAAVLEINANTAAARYRYALTKLRQSLSVEKGESVRVQAE